MTRKRRALTTLGSVAIALVLVSCGVEAGDAASPTASFKGDSTVTTIDRDLTTEQQQMADAMADAYRGLGFTDKESTCLAEGLAGSIGGVGSTPDVSAMMDIVNECDIPIDRLMEIQGGMGDGTPEGALKESLQAGFKVSGMTDEEASCVADAFIEKYGVDVEAMTDADKMASIAKDCGVDPSKIRTGN